MKTYKKVLALLIPVTLIVSCKKTETEKNTTTTTNTTTVATPTEYYKVNGTTYTYNSASNFWEYDYSDNIYNVQVTSANFTSQCLIDAVDSIEPSMINGEYLSQSRTFLVKPDSLVTVWPSPSWGKASIEIIEDMGGSNAKSWQSQSGGTLYFTKNVDGSVTVTFTDIAVKDKKNNVSSTASGVLKFK